MAVPWEQERVRNAVELAAETGATIVWDRQHSAFETWQRTLAEAGVDPAVLLQDDVELTEDWRAKVEAVISEHPDTVIQFFSMRKADETVGSRWEPGRTYLMNQCHYLPAGAAARLLDYSQDWHLKDPRNPTCQDLATAGWLRDTGQRYWLHVPSLVQHRPWASTLGARSKARQSRTFR
jgi:hypothetical protein